MNDEKPKKGVSPRRLAANRENAKRSTRPRTELGKQRASENSYKHGFFAKRLFPTQEMQKQDIEEYNSISRAYWNHYRPVGNLEKLCVEQIAVQSLRLARMPGHDAKVLAYETPFELRPVDKIVRYESNISRPLEKTIARLEQLPSGSWMCGEFHRAGWIGLFDHSGPAMCGSTERQGKSVGTNPTKGTRFQFRVS